MIVTKAFADDLEMDFVPKEDSSAEFFKTIIIIVISRYSTSRISVFRMAINSIFFEYFFTYFVQTQTKYVIFTLVRKQRIIRETGLVMKD